MRKHPISAIVRLLPALLWLFAPVVFLWQFVELLAFTPDGSADSAIDWLVVLYALVLLGLTVFAVRMAYKEYKDAQYALRADIPIQLGWWTARRKRVEAPQRYPLSEPLRAKAREMLDALLAAGVLQPGEAPLEVFIDCAEMNDDYQDLDIYDVAAVLHAVKMRRGQSFANLVFFTDQVEVFEADIVSMVREFARLSGQSERLGPIRVTGIDGGQIALAGRGEFPRANAVVELDLGTERHAVPFVMYSKNVPGHLMEGLAKVFARADDPRRFVSAYYDGDFGVSYLLPEKIAALNSVLPREPFEPLELPQASSGTSNAG